MLTDKFISVVVTCYKDEGSITHLLERLESTMRDVTPNWEVIYVNDASPDNAEEVLLKQAETNPRLTIMSHSRNFGAQVAFTTGMYQAKGDAVVIMDGDLQDPPEMIRDFVGKWLEGNEVVYGIRAKRNEGLAKEIGYKGFYRIMRKISYLDVPLDAGEFSLMDRAVVDAILACPERDRLIRGLRAYAGFRQVGIEFERPQRYWGDSTQSLLDYFMWAVKSFTSYSLVPLRFISVVALIMFAILTTMFLVYLAVFLTRDSIQVDGFMTLLSLQLLIGGINLLALGIIGEYLARLFLEIKHRPQPILKFIVNDHRDKPRQWLGRTDVTRSNISQDH